MCGVYLNKIHVFCYVAGETAVTLSVMVNKIRVDVGAPRHLPHTPISNRKRRCLLDERNWVLIVMMWLHQYLKLHVLAYIFNISRSKVAGEIYHIVPIIFVNYRLYISWHNLKNPPPPPPRPEHSGAFDKCSLPKLQNTPHPKVRFFL